MMLSQFGAILLHCYRPRCPSVRLYTSGHHAAVAFPHADGDFRLQVLWEPSYHAWFPPAGDDVDNPLLHWTHRGQPRSTSTPFGHALVGTRRYPRSGPLYCGCPSAPAVGRRSAAFTQRLPRTVMLRIGYAVARAYSGLKDGILPGRPTTEDGHCLVDVCFISSGLLTSSL